MQKKIISLLMAALLLTGCKVSIGTPKETTAPPTPEEEYQETLESEQEQIAYFFSEKMTDPEVFTDSLSYQYYARTLGLDKDYFLDIENWEVYYNEKINLNRDIDNASIYLIRLNPDKLLEIYARRCELTVDALCENVLGQTRDTLYYNWGYNVTSENYGKSHENNILSYSDLEKLIFGEYNGEDRQSVMSTHFIILTPMEKTKINYSSTSKALAITRRDLLKSVTTKSPLYCQSYYDPSEIQPAFYLDDVGISRLIPLNLPNAYVEAQGADAATTLMMNCSPYSYGCTKADLIDMSAYYRHKEAETTVEDTAAESQPTEMENIE